MKLKLWGQVLTRWQSSADQTRSFIATGRATTTSLRATRFQHDQATAPCLPRRYSRSLNEPLKRMWRRPHNRDAIHSHNQATPPRTPGAHHNSEKFLGYNKDSERYRHRRPAPSRPGLINSHRHLGRMGAHRQHLFLHHQQRSQTWRIIHLQLLWHKAQPVHYRGYRFCRQ